MSDTSWRGKLQGEIAVLMGGTASEREISLQSGAAVLQGLRELDLPAVGIDTADDVIGTLQRSSPALAFIAVHGAGGEDGKLQAVLEYLGVPYTGSGVLASALAMDKLRSKHIWRGLGLPTPAYSLLDPVPLQDSKTSQHAAINHYKKVLDSLGGSVFVKPVAEGSSFGMAIANSAGELEQAYLAACAFGQPVMAECLVRGPEYTVAIVNGRCLPSIRIETARSFYDFDAKYHDDDTRFHVPSGLDAQLESGLQRLALEAFNALGCSGWGRVDVMRDAASGAFYLLEVNTVPGLTGHSLVPMAAAAAGLTFKDLVAEVIQAAICAPARGKPC